MLIKLFKNVLHLFTIKILSYLYFYEFPEAIMIGSKAIVVA